MRTDKKKSAGNAGVYFRTAAAVYMGLMFSVFILWFGEQGLSAITESKYYFFRNVTSGYLIVNAVLLLELVCVGEIRPAQIAERVRRMGAARWCMLAYAVIAAGSAFCSEYGVGTWIGLGRYEGLSTIFLYVGAFLLISLCARFDEWMVWLMGATGAVFSVICILQFNRLNPFGLYQGEFHYDGIFLGTIGNVNMIGGLLCMMIPVMMTAIAVWQGRRRYWLLAPLVLCSTIWTAIEVDAALLGIVGVCALLIPVVCPTAKRLSGLCLSYAALLAGAALTELFDFKRANEVGICYPEVTRSFLILLLAVVLLAAGSRVLEKESVASRVEPKMIRIFALAVLGIGTVGGVVILKWFCPVSEGFLYELSRLLNGQADASFGSNRLLIWTETMKLVKEHPFLGGGPDTLNARLVVEAVLDPSVSTQLETVAVDSAHNEYLNILVNTGVFSLIAYLGALLVLAVCWVRKSLENERAAILGAGILGYAIQAFFSFSITMTTPIFWILLGLLCGLSDEREDRSSCIEE